MTTGLLDNPSLVIKFTSAGKYNPYGNVLGSHWMNLALIEYLPFIGPKTSLSITYLETSHLYDHFTTTTPHVPVE